MCSHIPLKEWTQIRKVTLRMWTYKNGSIVFMLTFAKTKRDLFWAQTSMVIWQQQSTILNEGRESRNNHRYAVVVQVLATQWNPCKTKTSQETDKNLRKFFQPSQKPKVIHTYNLSVFAKYCEELSWNHRTTTLYQSDTIRIAEWAVRRPKEVTSAVLLQFESDDKWWLDSMERYCYLRADQDFLADSKSQNKRRFGESFWDMLCSRVEFGKIFWLRRLKNWKSYIRNMSQKTECERSLENPKKVENPYFLWQMVQQDYQEETTNSKNPLWGGNPS